MGDDRRRARRFGLVILLVGAACSSEAPPPTDAPASDAASAPDAADQGVLDARGAEDVAPVSDAAAPDQPAAMDVHDAPPATDAPVTTDAPPAMDAPVTMDAPPAQDASAPDAPSAPDVPAAEVGACAAPQTSCPTDGGAPVCTDLRGDTQHCGRCEVACCFGLRCLEGVCTSVRCPPLQTPCTASAPTPAGCYDAPCRDLLGDDAHCGACGNACAKGTFCLRGRCEG